MPIALKSEGPPDGWPFRHDAARARWFLMEAPSRSTFLLEHGLGGRPGPAFPDHALGLRAIETDLRHHESDLPCVA